MLAVEAPNRPVVAVGTVDQGPTASPWIRTLACLQTQCCVVDFRRLHGAEGCCRSEDAPRVSSYYGAVRLPRAKNKLQILVIRNRRNRRLDADFWLGSVSSTLPE